MRDMQKHSTFITHMSMITRGLFEYEALEIHSNWQGAGRVKSGAQSACLLRGEYNVPPLGQWLGPRAVHRKWACATWRSSVHRP